MNNQEIKILLSVEQRGATLRRSKEKETIKWFITKQDVSQKKLPKDVGNQIIKSGKVTRYPLITDNSTLYIKLTKDSYNFFVSDYCPAKHLMKNWKKMNSTQRLEYHLQILCEHHKGMSYTYNLLDD